MKKSDFGFIMGVAVVVALSATGCLSVKTEHEVKPIEINMNINLKVDKEIGAAISDQSKNDKFAKIDALIEKESVGLDNNSMLVPRGPLSADEMELVAAANARAKEMFAKIAKDNGKTPEEVAKSGVTKFVEHRASKGGKTWYQKPDGTWERK